MPALPLLRRELLLGSCAFVAAASGCDANELPGELWASAQGGDPGSFELVVVGPARVRARFPTDTRGHGLAVHPAYPQRVVMFARRPGRVGIVGDVRSGEVVGRIETPAGRHQCGHGCFSADGSRLFVVEAHDEGGRGIVVELDASTLARLREFDTHGVGPHQIELMPDGATLVVANGGLVTEPGGRDPINLDTMDSSLVYLDAEDGALISAHRVPEPKASLRHLDVADDGTVAVVMQIQRDILPDTEPRSLIAVHHPRGELVALEDGLEVGTAMEDYAGGVAVDAISRVAAVTSPRGNLVAYWDVDSGSLLQLQRFDDVSGVAVSADASSFVFTGSGGQLRRADAGSLHELPQARATFEALRWDNHLLTLPI